MASSSVRILYEAVDAFWLSRLGEAALGTPIVSWPYPDIVFAVAFGLSGSVSAIAGQYIGAGLYDRASRSAGTVLGLIMAIAVPGSIAVAATAPFYLEAIGVPGTVKPLAELYLAVIALGTPFSALFLFFNMLLGAAGDTRTPVKVSIAATAINAVLDPILIFVAGLGVLGAALATFIASVFSASYAAYSLATGRHGFRLRLRDLVPDRSLLPLVARVSAPLVAQRLGMTLGFMVMAGIVAGLGEVVLAAYQVGHVALGIDSIISMPLARSVGIVVAQSLGAGQTWRARRAVKTGLLLLAGFVGAYIAVIVCFAEEFARIFTDNPETVRVIVDMLHIFGPSILSFNILMMANNVARSSGYTLFVSALGIARLWLLRIPLTWLLAYKLGLGEKGLWTGMAISNHATGAAALAWLARGTWAKPVIRQEQDNTRASQDT